MKIHTLGDEILRKKAIVIPDIDQSIADLAEAMIETMRTDDGIGLAAPQVGEGIRMFVCRVGNGEAWGFVNPEIIGTSQEMVPYEEGCLSIPGVYTDIIRPARVTVQAWNLRGRPFTLDAEGILARVIQHELDHLNGVLFIDHLEEKKRTRLIKQYDRKFA
jgi:peptide deformylase